MRVAPGIEDIATSPTSGRDASIAQATNRKSCRIGAAAIAGRRAASHGAPRLTATGQPRALRVNPKFSEPHYFFVAGSLRAEGTGRAKGTLTRLRIAPAGRGVIFRAGNPAFDALWRPPNTTRTGAEFKPKGARGRAAAMDGAAIVRLWGSASGGPWPRRLLRVTPWRARKVYRGWSKPRGRTSRI